jgi:rod shape-determining protein MreD
MGRYIIPFVYVLFIISLPFEIPNWLLLILSFCLGICIDLFYNTAGMHAAACLVMAYIRPAVLKLFSPREGYEFGMKPTIQYLGTVWFVSYAGILIFVHHFVLFYIEVFRFTEFFSTLLRVIVSSLFTLLLVILIQFLFKQKKEE